MKQSQEIRPKVIRIDRLQDYSKQEILNFIACKLLKQKKKSLNKAGSCRYRFEMKGNHVLKCAIGQCIPKKLYNRVIEGKTVDNITELLKITCNQDQMDLLIDLQKIHDKAIVGSWFMRLQETAGIHRLCIEFDELGNYIPVR